MEVWCSRLKTHTPVLLLADISAQMLRLSRRERVQYSSRSSMSDWHILCSHIVSRRCSKEVASRVLVLKCCNFPVISSTICFIYSPNVSERVREQEIELDGGEMKGRGVSLGSQDLTLR